MDIENAAQKLLQGAQQKGLMIATAESCTGGMITAALTDIAGSSAVFDRGFITYSNAAKMQMLGVAQSVIAAHGAVSEEVAKAMAEGALRYSAAQLSISVTGIAGPSGGSDEKPVGLVHFASAKLGEEVQHQRKIFSGTRAQIRSQATLHALGMLLARI